MRETRRVWYHQSLSWLQCDTDQESNGMVDCLWCEFCMKGKQNTQGSKTFTELNNYWVTNSSNQKHVTFAGPAEPVGQVRQLPDQYFRRIYISVHFTTTTPPNYVGG